MTIRPTTYADIDALMAIFDYALSRMLRHFTTLSHEIMCRTTYHSHSMMKWY